METDDAGDGGTMRRTAEENRETDKRGRGRSGMGQDNRRGGAEGTERAGGGEREWRDQHKGEGKREKQK